MSVINPITGKAELDPANAIGINPSAFTLDLSMWAAVALPGAATAAGATIVTASSADALDVGRQGATSPALKVSTNVASSVTGFQIIARATGSGVSVAAIGGGTDEKLTIDAKGAGTVVIGNVSTGNIQLGATANDLVLNNTTGALTLTSAAVAAFTVGRLGATTPAFQVEADAAVQVTGLLVVGNTSGSGVQLSAQGGGAAETLDLDSKGSGLLRLQTTATGHVSQAHGDYRNTVGNLRLGVVSAFATTEPTSAVVMKTGTAPVGAIATSGGIFSSATVVRKIIADGTVSNVET